jgi:hypothetical protein
MKKWLTVFSAPPMVTLMLLATVMKSAPSSFAGGDTGVTNWPAAVSTNVQFKAGARLKSQAKAVLPVESAFSKGLDAVGGRFNVYASESWIGLRRTTTNCWVMTFHRYSGPDTNAIRLIIKDDGSVEPSEGPVGMAQPSPDSKIPSPRAAFRKALRSLEGRLDFTEPRGHITFSRSSTPEWDIHLSGYKGLLINGLMLSVSDDLQVTEWSAP